jgi:nitroreductase
MFNDLSTPAALFTTRRSGKARARVPDHGKLAPWRFVIIDPDRRDALSQVIVDAYRAERPEAGRLEIEAMDGFARHAPALVAMLFTPVTSSKIPLWEQQLSAGAAAMQLLNATHAHGFVGNWLTGWAAESRAVADALGANSPDDRIVGFFFIGTATKELEERPRPGLSTVISHW